MKTPLFASAILLGLGAAHAAGGSPVDPNTFIVQPPASVTWTVRSANHEHPAVVVARRRASIDANTFIVQPPARVSWTLQSEPQQRTLALVR